MENIQSKTHLSDFRSGLFHEETNALMNTELTSKAGPMGPDNFNPSAKIDEIYKFVVGEDKDFPKQMTAGEKDTWINDPFANNFFKKGIFPLTMNNLCKNLKQSGLTTRVSYFLIAENGQIPWKETAQNVKQTARIVLVASSKGGIGPDILVSTGTGVDSDEEFLQLMSWDPKTQAYNFYQRLNDLWIWSGNGFHSLPKETRNKGPFSGHINGGPVMKELHSPWENWNSSEATISPNAFQKDDPFLQTGFFQKKEKADSLELTYNAGISAWNLSRISHAVDSNGIIYQPHYLIRQVTSTTNVNLISSPNASKVSDDSVVLPFSFFANFKAFEKAGVLPLIPRIKVTREFYESSLQTFKFSLESNNVTIPGDKHFAFCVPEPAQEDIDLIGKMIQKEIISKKLIASILMVDFQNPIYSKIRAVLESYIPEEVVLGNNGKDLDEKFVQNVLQSEDASKPGSPEYQFLENWNIRDDNWSVAFEAKITSYFSDLNKALESQEGFNDIVLLSESRRYEFKQTGLYEFDLTFPTTNIPENKFPLQMTLKGGISKKT